MNCLVYCMCTDHEPHQVQYAQITNVFMCRSWAALLQQGCRPAQRTLCRLWAVHGTVCVQVMTCSKYIMCADHDLLKMHYVCTSWLAQNALCMHIMTRSKCIRCADHDLLKMHYVCRSWPAQCTHYVRIMTCTECVICASHELLSVDFVCRSWPAQCTVCVQTCVSIARSITAFLYRIALFWPVALTDKAMTYQFTTADLPSDPDPCPWVI